MTDKTALALDLEINTTQLIEDCARQPALFAYYAEQFRKASARYKHLKLQFEVYEAALDKSVRDNFIARAQKFTERQVETAIRLNPEWQKRKEEVIAAETEAAQCDAIVKAFGQKKDMLVTISSNQRAERFAGVRTDDLQNHIPVVGPEKD